jgi:hypothetical protein
LGACRALYLSFVIIVAILYRPSGVSHSTIDASWGIVDRRVRRIHRPFLHKPDAADVMRGNAAPCFPSARSIIQPVGPRAAPSAMALNTIKRSLKYPGVDGTSQLLLHRSMENGGMRLLLL